MRKLAEINVNWNKINNLKLLYFKYQFGDGNIITIIHYLW